MDGKEHAIAMTHEGQMNIFEASYMQEHTEKWEESKMVEQAMAKLQAELRVNGVHPYVSAIGNFLMDHIKDNPSAAEKIMTKDKTIVGSMKAMSKIAEKQKVDNCAVLTPEQGYKAVLDYFGIKTAGTAPIVKAVAPVTLNDAPKESVATAPRPTQRFEASLDEFL
ncbi:hypothetical protein C3943_13030 [Lysinibacillus sp. B2A1]|nr:hypothetical protein C3943_13030 [Lysinibacillus sp. B2A1]